MVDGWRTRGVRIVGPDEFDDRTAQTTGMYRQAAVCAATSGASKLWAGVVTIVPDARTGPHHHGALESVIYVVRGVARMRWGTHLEYTAEAGPGHFIYVPPYIPHQEINNSSTDELFCVIVRSDQEPVVVNLDLDSVAEPQTVSWIDPLHASRP